MSAYVQITIDGKEVPVKDFVQDIIGASIEAMVKTLRMVPAKYQEVSVVIRPADRPVT